MILCEQCHFPGIVHPILKTRVGTLHGEPVYRHLCNTCARNARRTWATENLRKQFQHEMAQAQARYGD